MWGSADLGVIRVMKALGGVGSCRKHVSVHDKKVKDRALILIMVTRERGTTNEADEDQTNGGAVGGAQWVLEARRGETVQQTLGRECHLLLRVKATVVGGPWGSHR